MGAESEWKAAMSSLDVTSQMDGADEDPATAHREHGSAWAFLSLHFAIGLSVLIAGSIASINFLGCKSIKKPLTILYLHLFFVDLLSSVVLVLALPKRLASRLLVIPSEGYCQFEGFLVGVSSYCELSTIACIALERYLAVVATERGKRLQSIPLYVIVSTDVWFLFSGLTRTALGRNIQPANTVFCRGDPLNIDQLDDILSFTDASIQVLSLCTIGFCYARIAAKVWTVLSSARLDGLNAKLGTSAAPTVERSRVLTVEFEHLELNTSTTPHPPTDQRRRPSNFVAVLHPSDLQKTFLSFVVAALALTLWLPVAVLITIETFPDAPPPGFIMFSSFAVLTHLHTLVDNVIVTAMDAQLRNELPRTLRWIGAPFFSRPN
ncbi:family A G protein-coupled receptor-like protein [Gonapodya prolifera JEL478]|uniref:Family A G protein-coupled receptor-like protein n=1 Tax=Gonapodya prolifera (strain JEL478) TaxID=1344416 RepID=A0A139AJA9_GONPJ|nr:family A G protein-coupled receptor-like protein [Gonapodya prolifera JEL478]|eukprot:KXS16877.1 family A G protein-coupled receptor-like protein [Gonapodya prolifera JEL478]